MNVNATASSMEDPRMTSKTPDASAFCDVAELLRRNYLRNAGFDDSTKEPVILIVGAGTSEISHFPQWEKLKAEILKVGKRDRADFVEEVWESLEARGVLPSTGDDEHELLERKDIPVEILAGIACRRSSSDKEIRRLLYRHYAAGGLWEEAGPPPLLVYELMAHLVKHGFIDHVITFNFDELLDVALPNELGDGAFLRIFSGYECVSDRDQEKPSLIKIHGTVSSPESMRFTDADSAKLACARNVSRGRCWRRSTASWRW